MAESNVELVRRGYDAALRGDLKAIAELLDPDVKWHGGDPTAAGSCHNRDQVLGFMKQAFDSGGWVPEVVFFVGTGDDVVVILGPQGGDSPVANLTTFRDGKV